MQDQLDPDLLNVWVVSLAFEKEGILTNISCSILMRIIIILVTVFMKGIYIYVPEKSCF